MTLTVLNVAYPLSSVTEDAVGGAEQVLAAIDSALVDVGAISIVVACEGSVLRGRLCATAARQGHLDAATCAAAREAHAHAIANALDRFSIDVVHLHGVDFHEYLPGAGVPVLATLHLPPSWYPSEALTPMRPATFVHCVSESQRRSCPPSSALLPTITNGVAIPADLPPRRKEPYVVAMGRICPEKGFHLGLDAAHRARVPMTLAGRVFAYPDHERYFATEIVPRLDDARQFVGALGVAEKHVLLARARCVLVPSIVPETSSLVAMEALAVGTPVVAFANDALAEIVEHGVTGFLVRDEREMAEAIAEVETLDPDACRAAAISRYSVDAMTRRYLARYQSIAGGESVRKGEPARDRLYATVRGSGSVASLEVAELQTANALEQITARWRRLCDAAGCMPFQRPEWLVPWWRHLGVGTLRVLAVERGGELVGLAPLYVRIGESGARELVFVGAGNSDYLDVIAEPAWRGEVAAAVVEWIARRGNEWDECDLWPLPSASELLTARAPEGWRSRIDPRGVCPVLSIGSPTTGVERVLEHVVPPKMLGRLRDDWRRLTRRYVVEIEEAHEENATHLFDELFALHAARWQARGERGVLDDARIREFHGEVVPRLAVARLLRLYVLRVDGRAVAAFYGFADRSRLYCYLGGFDPAYARFSVASLVMLHALEQGMMQGVTALDFLQGAEEYKYHWGAKDEVVYGLRLERDASVDGQKGEVDA